MKKKSPNLCENVSHISLTRKRISMCNAMLA